MAEETSFCRKNVLHYLMYVALIALCLSGILYLLMHARPQTAPQVKHESTTSRLTRPFRLPSPPFAMPGVASAA